MKQSKKRYSDDQLFAVWKSAKEGMSNAQIARLFDISIGEAAAMYTYSVRLYGSVQKEISEDTHSIELDVKKKLPRPPAVYSNPDYSKMYL